MSILRNVSGSRWDAGMVISLGQSADLHMAQLMPLPFTISCSSKSRLVLPEWFRFSGAGLPRLSWKKAVKRMCSLYRIQCIHQIQACNQETNAKNECKLLTNQSYRRLPHTGTEMIMNQFQYTLQS